MDVSLFISRKLQYQGQASFSSRVMKVASFTVALGACLLVIAVSILHGFRDNIEDKVYSFGAHIRVSGYNDGSNNEAESAIQKNGSIDSILNANKGVKSFQEYAYKPALLKTGKDVQGVILQGYSTDADTLNIRHNLIAGKLPSINDSSESTGVLISHKIATLLKLDVGNDIVLFFLQNPARIRRLTVTGIYETGLEEFDENIVLGDLNTIKHINQWGDSLTGGYTVYVNDVNNLDSITTALSDAMPFNVSVNPVTTSQQQIFEWLGMIGRNVQILVVLIIVVACFNMISTLLIMILERSRMIGILKTLGANDNQIRRIFVLNGLKLVSRGLLAGNAVGLLLCFLQWKFHLIPLDPENYYMYYVPISWVWLDFLGINVLLLVAAAISLYIPATVIAGISPVKAIKFD